MREVIHHKELQLGPKARRKKGYDVYFFKQI